LELAEARQPCINAMKDQLEVLPCWASLGLPPLAYSIACGVHHEISNFKT